MILKPIGYKDFEASAHLNHVICICQSNTRLGAVQGMVELATFALKNRKIFDEPITLFKRVRYDETVPTLYRPNANSIQRGQTQAGNVVVSDL